MCKDVQQFEAHLHREPAPGARYLLYTEDQLMSTVKYLDPPPAASRDKSSFELLRVWVAEQGQHVSLRSGVWDDSFAWGIVLADLARHIVHAESLQRPNLDEAAFLERMLEGFQAEIESPTDEPEGEITQ